MSSSYDEDTIQFFDNDLAEELFGVYNSEDKTKLDFYNLVPAVKEGNIIHIGKEHAQIDFEGIRGYARFIKE